MSFSNDRIAIVLNQDRYFLRANPHGNWRYFYIFIFNWSYPPLHSDHDVGTYTGESDVATFMSISWDIPFREHMLSG